jgi:type VI secretion system VasD/TssJ family lipoprotein
MNLKMKKEGPFNLRTSSACTGALKYFVFTLFYFSLLAGCGGKPLAPPQADYAQQALCYHFVASSQLNLYADKPHALDSSVISRKRVVLQPGQEKDLVLDRAQGTRYLGLVAGYYDRHRGSFAKVIQVPVGEKRVGFLWIKKERYLDVVDMTVYLQARGIELK